MPYIGNIVQDFSVNNAMLNTDSVTSIKIDDGTIVNADINDSAAISMSKLALSITNSEVSASAAIAGSKISPDFGSQAISTTGSATIGGVLQVTTGSNSAPAIHFGDSDSGIYAASGGNNVRIAVGGSDAISASTAGGINFALAAKALTSLTLGSQSATDKPLFFADANSVESSSLLLDNSSNEFRVRNNRFSGKIVFAPSSNVERARIDNGGKLLVGTSTARTNFFNAASTHTPRLQIESTNSNSGRAALGLIYGIANASGPYIVMAKHRSNTVGDNTVVVSGDETGIIAFQGSDGSQFVDAARIQGFVDGTPGADDMPGRLVFSTTADGAASPTERLRIDSSGNVGIGTTNPLFPLETVFTNNNSSSFSTSLAMGSGANADLYALHLQNLGVLTSEVGLLFSAGNTEFGQWSVNCLKTGSFVGDLAFRTRTGSATSAERMRLDSSGRLLVGTTDTPSKLTVDTDFCVVRSSSDPTINLLLGSSSSITQIYRILIDDSDSDKLQIRSGDTPRVTMTTGGFVGIGQTNPSQPLHVLSTTNPGILSRNDSGGTGVRMQTDAGSACSLSFSDLDAHNQGLILYHHADDRMQFNTAGSERMRIDSSGRVLIGHTSARSVAGGNSKIQVESNDSTGRISIVQNRNEASGAPFLSLGKSRGTSVGGTTIVQDDDTVGTIAFAGADGNDFPSLAQIVASVDGTPGNNDMPGRLCFHTTADGSETPTENMRIDSGGQISMPYYGDGNYTVGVRLYVSYIYDSTANVANAITIASRPDALVTKHIRFWYTQHGSGGGSELGSITSNNAGSVSYNTSSDYRLKENATPISDGITRLKTLKPYRFNFIDIPDTTLDGFFAHECTAVPESITGTKDAVTPDGKIDAQSIDQSKLVPLITAALQEAISKIETLETKVAALEAA